MPSDEPYRKASGLVRSADAAKERRRKMSSAYRVVTGSSPVGGAQTRSGFDALVLEDRFPGLFLRSNLAAPPARTGPRRLAVRRPGLVAAASPRSARRRGRGRVEPHLDVAASTRAHGYPTNPSPRGGAAARQGADDVDVLAGAGGRLPCRRAVEHASTRSAAATPVLANGRITHAAVDLVGGPGLTWSPTPKG